MKSEAFVFHKKIQFSIFFFLQISKTTEKGEKITQSVASKRLLKKVDSMISKLDKVLEDLENTEKKIQEGLKAGGTEDAKTSELVRIDEIVNAIRKVRLPSHSLNSTA